MSLFSDYARYYDLLYKEKDYAGEADYIDRLVRKHAPDARTMLELGCGTGLHARLLAERGYVLHGVDQSEEMLKAAKIRHATMDRHAASRLAFSAGDIRSIRLPETYDAVLSLFHVVSYQTADDDIRATFATVRHHLAPGGIFLFDIWYGPAVVHQRPTVRIKRIEDNHSEMTRIAEPVMHESSHIIDVNYQVFVRNKGDKYISELRETHRMRYLFDEEIQTFLKGQGMAVIDSFEWMTGRVPGPDTWSVCYAVK